MKKKCAKILSILLLVVITINGNLFVVYGAIAEGNIVLNASNINLAVINNAKINNVTYKNTYQLKATISLTNATNKTVAWSSSNSNIASVSNGLITAKASGTAIITATTSNGKKATCKVNVVYNPNKSTATRFNESTKNSTVWPIKQIPFYDSVAFTNKKGNFNALEEAIIIEVQSGVSADTTKMHIRNKSGNKNGWVENNNLLINLPDVRSDISYNITNAYKSIFKIGSTGANISSQDSTGYVNMPRITDKKLYSYDNYDENTSDGKVWNQKIKRYEYVCPVIYKLALDIGTAQNTALQNGYCLKIYDGYRPEQVCRIFWDSGLEAIGCKMNADGTAQYINGYANMKPYNSRSKSEKKATELTGGYITDGRKTNISYFIASTRGKSNFNDVGNHACGTSVDLTMVYKDNKTKEIPAQSEIHDLSANSLTQRNNESAQILNKIMTGANLNSLFTEWWHFNLKSNPSSSWADGQVTFSNLYDVLHPNKKPIVNVEGIPTDWTKTAKLIVNVTNSQAEIVGYSFNGSEFTTNNKFTTRTSGNVKIKVKDNIGNILEKTLVIDKVDSERPEIKELRTSLPTNKKSVKLTIVAEDRGKSGIKEYSFNKGKDWQTSNEFTYFTNQKIAPYTIWVKDNAGNISYCTKQIVINGIE